MNNQYISKLNTPERNRRIAQEELSKLSRDEQTFHLYNIKIPRDMKYLWRFWMKTYEAL